MFGSYPKSPYICTRYAEIAQLVEHIERLLEWWNR